MFKQYIFLLSLFISLSCGKKDEDHALNNDNQRKNEKEILFKPCENEFRVEPKPGKDPLKIGDTIQVCFNHELAGRMAISYDENTKLLESPSPYEIRLAVVKNAPIKIRVKSSRKDGQGSNSFLATYGTEPETDPI